MVCDPADPVLHPLPWALTTPPVQELEHLVVVGLGFLFGVGKNRDVGRKGAKAAQAPESSSGAVPVCSPVCVLLGLRARGAFTSMSGP